MQKVALITGITGQDGSYLTELLLEKGYEVHGIHRRSSLPNTGRIEHLLDKITLHYGDLTDSTSRFFRAAVYFNCSPNQDSLAPVISFLGNDVQHLIESFQWQ